jgi:hypothetical protein
MNWMELAKLALHETENKLRELLASAGSAGDYEAVVLLAKMAKAISAVPYEEVVNGATKPTGGIASKRKLTLRKRSKRRHARLSKNNGYPHFLRQGDQLVKIGWSKSSKSEYQHKAPRRAVTLFASATMGVCKGGAMFSAQDLAPLIDPEDKSEVPDYQVYLALGWLRHNGLVKQHGRQGYTVANPDLFLSLIDEKWESLTTK